MAANTELDKISSLQNIELSSSQNTHGSSSSKSPSRSSIREGLLGTVVYSEIEDLTEKLRKEAEAYTECIPDLNDALRTNNMEKLKRLMKGGAPYLYDALGCRPLELCAIYSRPDITNIILERHKEEGNSCDQESFQRHASLALYQACIFNSVETANLLLAADIPILKKVHPHTAAQHGSWGVLDLLYKKELYIDERDKYCLTTLHYASKKGYAPTVGYLLALGADPNATCDLNGKTPLHLASEYASEDVLYLLVTNGAKLDLVDDQGQTGVLIAAYNGKAQAVTIMANSGANLDFRDRSGRTALIIAATNGHANVVRELIVNGASLDEGDIERYNALERAIILQRDRASAMIIRLAPMGNFIEYSINCMKLSVHNVVKLGMEQSMLALLDRMIIIDSKSRCTVNTKYLDLDLNNQTPQDGDYIKNAVYFLQRISELRLYKVAHHGVIRLLVDEKMKRFGYSIFASKFYFYLVFLLALGYSLVQAAYEGNPFDAYLRGELNHFRIVTESFVLLYFIINVFTEIVEITRVGLSTYWCLKDERESQYYDIARDCMMSTFEDNEACEYNEKETIMSRIKSSLRFIVRLFKDYFRERSNYLDILSLLFLGIFIPLRCTSQSFQWVFATLTFLLNSIRLFNYIIIIPIIGPYSNIFYKIFIKDVPKFALMFLIVILIYSACFFIALRTPYSPQGVTNKSQIDSTSREIGVSDEFHWVLLSGVRIMIEGESVLQDNYIYNSLNWLAVIVYQAFLFFFIVVFLNVFIAQLSDRYAKVRINAERSSAWHRLNFLVQLQKSSLLSSFIDFRKRFFIEELSVETDKCAYYFGTSNMQSYHSLILEEDVDEKSLLTQIKHQVELSRKTQDLAQTMRLMTTKSE